MRTSTAEASSEWLSRLAPITKPRMSGPRRLALVKHLLSGYALSELEDEDVFAELRSKLGVRAFETQLITLTLHQLDLDEIYETIRIATHDNEPPVFNALRDQVRVDPLEVALHLRHWCLGELDRPEDVLALIPALDRAVADVMPESRRFATVRLGRLAIYSCALDHVKAHLDNEVIASREATLAWEKIGTSVGLKAPSAHARWSKQLGRERGRRAETDSDDQVGMS